MQYRKFGDKLVVRLDKNDEIVTTLKSIATKEKIKLAYITGIGASDNFSIGVFDRDKQQYNEFNFTGDHEITSLSGNITTMKGETYTHIHITCADKQGNAVGGHLIRCKISFTAEIFISIVDGNVDRDYNEDLGINTITFQ